MPKEDLEITLKKARMVFRTRISDISASMTHELGKVIASANSDETTEVRKAVESIWGKYEQCVVDRIPEQGIIGENLQTYAKTVLYGDCQKFCREKGIHL